MNPQLENLVLQHPKYLSWKKEVESTGTRIDHVDVLAAISRAPGQLIAAFIDTQMTTPEGDILPRCMLFRGKSVVIVPVIYCEDEEVYTLMVKQRRPVNGEFFIEFPGGVFDAGNEQPAALAIQELSEELQIQIKDTDLKTLHEEPVTVCTGMLDEQAYFFYFEKHYKKKDLFKLNGRVTGHHHEGEFLQVQVLKMSEVTNYLNFSALAGIKLLEQKLNRIF